MKGRGCNKEPNILQIGFRRSGHNGGRFFAANVYSGKSESRVQVFWNSIADRLCAAIKTLSKVQAEISEQQRRETCSAAFLTKSLDCTIYSFNDIINYNVLGDICPNVKGETKWKQSA